jgi:hypothetical protein
LKRILIRINVYKGDTRKREIKAYLEKNKKKITKITKFKIFNKFSDSILTIPLQIFPNCNMKFSEGEYTLKIEGLGTSTEQKINLEGVSNELCKIVIETEVRTNYDAPVTVINYSSSTIKEKIYESSTKKTERSALYFFVLYSVIVIIQLGIKNGNNKNKNNN